MIAQPGWKFAGMEREARPTSKTPLVKGRLERREMNAVRNMAFSAKVGVWGTRRQNSNDDRVEGKPLWAQTAMTIWCVCTCGCPQREVETGERKFHRR